MSWADEHIKKLSKGKEVTFRPRGRSMEPRIKDRALVTVAPARNYSSFRKGQIVLCKVKGKVYLHFITGVEEKMGQTRYQIGNNKGFTNGWATEIYGLLVRVER